MKDVEIILTVTFKNQAKELLYRGESWYRKGIVDHLEVSESSITLIFHRKKDVDQEFLFSTNSPARFQLYRAICFYLSVVGRIPQIEKMTFTVNGEPHPIDVERLTEHWANCNIDMTLDKEKAAKCFDEDGKRCYVAITYFLKAQLDVFSNDCFRAAWSGLNTLYDLMSEKPTETEKLKAFGNYILNTGLPNTESNVSTLDQRFWDRLQWHIYIQNRIQRSGKDRFLSNIISDFYSDRDIYDHIASYLLANRRNEEDERYQMLEEKLKAKRKLGDSSAREKARFLLTHYCYTLRNKTFHGERPYPVFRLEDEKAVEEERILTHLLLEAIRDLLNDYGSIIGNSIADIQNKVGG